MKEINSNTVPRSIVFDKKQPRRPVMSRNAVGEMTTHPDNKGLIMKLWKKIIPGTPR